MAAIFGMQFKSATGGFFDRKKVINAVDRVTRRVLSRFGAFVRRTAKQSIRKRKKSAAADRPPSSHEGTLKRLIFFAYNRSRDSVVIGPTQSGRGDVPRLLEEGGIIRRRDPRTGRSKMLRYKPHPYMKPALDKELPGLPAMWRNAVKR